MLEPSNLPLIESRVLRYSFNRAAATYDRAAVLQNEVRKQMLDRLDLFKISPKRLLDLGAGTGSGALALLKRYRGCRVFALDFAPLMLGRAQHKRPWFSKMACVAGHAEALPLASGSIDMVFSNALLPWCANPDTVLSECRRVLNPGGLLMFSSLGPDTLKELRTAWRAVDDCPHVNHFIDMHDLGDALIRHGFANPVMDVEHFTLSYASVADLCRDFRQTGSHNALHERRRTLTGKTRWNSMAEAYEQFRRDDRLPASFEIVHGHAWAGAQTPAPSLSPKGEVRIPIHQIGKRLPSG